MTALMVGLAGEDHAGEPMRIVVCGAHVSLFDIGLSAPPACLPTKPSLRFRCIPSEEAICNDWQRPLDDICIGKCQYLQFASLLASARFLNIDEASVTYEKACFSMVTRYQ